MIHSEVVCPFCGLLCDDLDVETRGPDVEVKANGCELSRRRFTEANVEWPGVKVGGRACSIDEATQRAGELLHAAAQPVMYGLATDLAGARAVLSLARRAGAIVDHANGAALQRNLSVTQHSGGFVTTLSEVRNRADLIVLMGTGSLARFPRLVERVFAPTQALVPERRAARECIAFGNDADIETHGASSWSVIACESAALGEVAMALRALVQSVELDAPRAGGIPMAQLRDVAERLAGAHYAVLVWSAAELEHEHAELSVEAFAELVRALNLNGRAASLPLGGTQGDVGMNQVCAWQSGWPLRVGFAQGVPDYDPHLNDVQRLVRDGEADCCLWLSSFAAEGQPPAGPAPLIALAHPGARFDVEPAVHIPVAIPGVDNAGLVQRSDGVVTLPLSRLREPRGPGAAKVLSSIEAALVRLDNGA
ncbi:MAG: formylmethanofuran dehydrogenase subunit B [Gammaproteobacteria bacterium]